MQLHYDPETRSLYIALQDGPGVDAKEIADGVVVDFDANGKVVGIDIDDASETLDLDTLEVISLPTRQTRIA